MVLDTAMMTIASLSVVIVILLGYIAWRFREQKVSLSALNIEDLFNRMKESETLLQKIKATPCWNCGAKEKEVVGNLFEDNEITVTCTKCGTQNALKRKKEWAIETKTPGHLEKLAEKVTAEKHSLGAKE